MLPKGARRTLAVLTLLLPSVASRSETLVFTLDPSATHISLGFGATLHSVDGSLGVQAGEVTFDVETGAASGRIVLDATSAETGNERRDRKMHEIVLESVRFPEMVFTVDHVGGAIVREGVSDLQLRGVLDMHGVELPFELLASATVEGGRVTAIGRVEVRYLEWGIKDPSVFLLRVQKRVHVTVEAVGTLAEVGEAATSPRDRE